jgi:hypothetical protein
MSEGIVSIGATFDKTNVDAGMTETQEIVKASMAAISSSVTEAGSKTKAAWKGISDDVKVAAQSVSTDTLKMAETSRAVAVAQADVRKAFTLTKDSAIPAAQSLSVLAAAQTKLTEAQATAAAVAKENAAAIAAAAREAALSSNFIIAGFQKAALSVKESAAAMRAQLVEIAVTGKISADGITAGFAGLSSLLGAGIAAGFAASYIDGLAKVNVELGHLSEKTGISVTALAGLQQMVRVSGGNWDEINNALVKMGKNLADSSESSKGLIAALGGINLKVGDLKGLKPEEQLEKIAVAFAGTSNHGNLAAAAIALFGRGGAALIPVLRQQGTALEDNMAKEGALTGITNQSVEAAQRWTADTAKLSAEFRSVMIPVLEHAEDVIGAVAGVFEAAAATMYSVFAGIATAVVALGRSFAGLGKIIWDGLTGNFKAIQGDFQSLCDGVVGTWKAGFGSIAEGWQEVAKRFHWSGPAVGSSEQRGGGEDDENAPGTAKSGRKGRAASSPAPNYGDLNTVSKIKNDSSSADNGQGIFDATVAKTQSDEILRVIGLINKANTDATKTEVAVARSAAEEKIRFAREDFEEVERDTANEVKLGTMSESQRVAAVKAAAEREKQIYVQASAEIQRLDRSNVTALQADLNKQAQAMRQYANQINQINQQAALETKKKWDKVFQDFNSKLNSSLMEIQSHAKTASQAFSQMFVELTKEIEQFLLKLIETKIEMALLKLIGKDTGGDKDASETGLKKAKANNPMVVESYSAAAAAEKFFASGGNIAAAMATYAEGMILYPLAAYDAGGVVGNGIGVSGTRGYHVPILAEAGERVLSGKQSANFEKMVNQSSNSSSVTNHNSVTQNINAWDRAGVKSMLASHADDILGVVQGGISSGKLSAA